MASITGLTIEDFENLPAALARNHELINGELVDVSGNTFRHNDFQGALFKVMRDYADDHKLGKVIPEQEYDFDGNAHGPDISFVSAARSGRINGTRRVQLFVPDLAIEIVSANDKYDAVIGKIKRYLTCGVKEAYLFSIEHRQASRHTPNGAQILTETDDFRPEQIPGFSIRIADLFAMIER